MNPGGEKIDKLKKSDQHAQQLGGKGTVRRKKKVVHKMTTSIEKKLQAALKKFSLHQVANIEEVNLIKDNGDVIHIHGQVKVASHMASSLFVISGGRAETKPITELLPQIIDQMGPALLQKMAGILSAAADTEASDAGVPKFTGNFDQFVEFCGGLPTAAGAPKQESEDVPEFTGSFEQFAQSDAANEPKIDEPKIEETAAANDNDCGALDPTGNLDKRAKSDAPGHHDAAKPKILETAAVTESDCGKKITEAAENSFESAQGEKQEQQKSKSPDAKSPGAEKQKSRNARAKK